MSRTEQNISEKNVKVAETTKPNSIFLLWDYENWSELSKAS